MRIVALLLIAIACAACNDTVKVKIKIAVEDASVPKPVTKVHTATVTPRAR